MAASARVAYLARRAEDYGVDTGAVSVDLKAVRQRKRDLVEGWRAGMEKRLKGTPGLDLIRGEAVFLASDVISASTPTGDVRELESDHIFLNTGGRTAVPDIPGLDKAPFLDSTSIMELDVIPEHLVVLGAGYVALEFAQMFRRFGSEVTIVHRGDRILAREDEDVASALAGILEQDGITILVGSPAEKVSYSEDERRFEVRTGGEESRAIAGSHLLVATGRRPNTEALDLGAAGIEVDQEGYIPVNDRLETNVPGIWALGDVKGGPAFTHISYDDYRVVKGNLLGEGGFSIADRRVPYVMFTDPQLGRIGLTETEARRRGLEIKIAKMNMDWVARALETAESRGFMKAVVEADTGHILGVAVLGVEGGELMALLQMAMLGGLGAEQLQSAVFAHPTLAESLNNLFANMD
jgi:pyruvate/2-oxoglutarate dehydrogenase complex dihydrolipoamide dehydrogenase (E3) component